MQQHGFATAMLLSCVVFGTLAPLRPAYGADQPVPLPSEASRPGAEAGPTKVSVGIWVIDISQIDSVLQMFSASFVVAMRWRDPLLVHSEPGARRYNVDDIWHPDWLVANAYNSSSLTLPEIAEVDGDGTVTYVQRVIGSFSQLLDLHAFPFDRGAFRIQIVVAGEAPQAIEFSPYEMMVAADHPTGSGIASELTLKDWRVTGFSARAAPYRIAPGVERAGYTFEFQAQRLSAHYVVKVIIPLLLIVIMSWMTFWLDPSLGDSQISIATTSMLTLIAYRFAVGADVPKLPYLTHLDAFILVSSVLVLITLIEVVVTSTLVRDGRMELARRIDRYSRWIIPLAYSVVFVATLFR